MATLCSGAVQRLPVGCGALEASAAKRARLGYKQIAYSDAPSAPAPAATTARTEDGQLPNTDFIVRYVLEKSGARATLFFPVLRRWAESGRESHGRIFSPQEVEEAIRRFTARSEQRAIGQHQHLQSQQQFQQLQQQRQQKQQQQQPTPHPTSLQAAGSPHDSGTATAPQTAPAAAAAAAASAAAAVAAATNVSPAGAVAAASNRTQAAGPVAIDDPPEMPGPLGCCLHALVDGPPVLGTSNANVVEIPLRTSSGRRVVAVLHGEWAYEVAESPWLLQPGDAVNIVGRFPSDAERIDVEDRGASGSLLVAHPSTLLTGTTIASTLECRRRALLKMEIQDDTKGRAALLGDVVHEITQACLASNDFSLAAMQAALQRALPRARLHLWALGDSEASFVADLQEHFRSLKVWAETYFAPSRRPQRFAARSSSSRKWLVDRLDAAEIMIKSSRFGVYGKIDACVRAFPPDLDDDGNSKLIALELKSGKPYAEHIGQAAVYRLLLGDLFREHRVFPGAMLLYTKSGHCDVHDIDSRFLRGMIRNRNLLAALLRRRQEAHLGASKSGSASRYAAAAPSTSAPHWPDLLRHPSMCSRCFSRKACAILHAALDGGNSESFNGGEGVFEEAGAAALSPATRAYVAEWLQAIEAEAAMTAREQALTWSKSSTAPGSRSDDDSRHTNVIRRVSGLRLVRNAAHLQALPPGECGTAARHPIWEFMASASIPADVLAPGDAVGISREGGPYCFADGVVESITGTSITVRSRSEMAQVLSSNSGWQRAASRLHDIEDAAGLVGEHVYRLDADIYGGSWRSMRGSLLRLSSSAEGQRLRDLIIELRQPRFSPAAAQQIAKENADLVSQLNEGQRAAVLAGLSAEDYAIISGFPGTGKTETLVALIRLLYKSGQRVLLCAHTHSAVDNVLARLKDQEPGAPFVRCGRTSQVRPELHGHVITSDGHAGGTQKWSSLGQVAEFAARHPIVACTCVGTSEVLVAAQHFDAVIVEEASQALECSLWGALLRCSDRGRFVLAGDAMQLPPLVRHPKSRSGHMGRSLLERLAEAHPSAVAELTEQYRMNTDIEAVANSLFYGGRLHSPPHVASALLELPSWPPVASSPWATSAVDPARSVVLMDTDGAGPAAQERAGSTGGFENPFEVQVVVAVVQALLGSGLKPGDILVISPYRKQLAALQAAFAAPGDDAKKAHAVPAACSAAVGCAGEASTAAQVVAAGAIAERAAAAAAAVAATSAVGAAACGSSVGSSAVVAAATGGASQKFLSDVEVTTVDRSQGRAARCIIFSAVRSNGAKCVGDLLCDWRRLNVAISRARHKLVVVGSASTLGGAVPPAGSDVEAGAGVQRLHTLLHVCRERGWLLPIEAC